LICHTKGRIGSVFGNRVMKIVFGAEREEVIGEGGKRWAEWGKKDEQKLQTAEGRTEMCAKSWSLI
jgi:hypothetical protein